jgi:multidrug efflux pump subunit AcrA (membrane-fusion protein)
LPGKIVRLVSAADAMSHTHLVKLDVPGIKGFSSGTFARVRFTVGSRQGISVPKAALLERAGITGVFVVDADGIAHYRMVRVGREQDDMIEIEAGLNPGEKVVIRVTGSMRPEASSHERKQSTHELRGATGEDLLDIKDYRDDHVGHHAGRSGRGDGDAA